MATAQILESIYCFLVSPRFYLHIQHSLDPQWQPEDPQEVVLRTPANHCFQIAG